MLLTLVKLSAGTQAEECGLVTDLVGKRLNQHGLDKATVVPSQDVEAWKLEMTPLTSQHSKHDASSSQHGHESLKH